MPERCRGVDYKRESGHFEERHEPERGALVEVDRRAEPLLSRERQRRRHVPAGRRVTCRRWDRVRLRGKWNTGEVEARTHQDCFIVSTSAPSMKPRASSSTRNKLSSGRTDRNVVGGKRAASPSSGRVSTTIRTSTSKVCRTTCQWYYPYSGPYSTLTQLTLCM